MKYDPNTVVHRLKHRPWMKQRISTLMSTLSQSHNLCTPTRFALRRTASAKVQTILDAYSVHNHLHHDNTGGARPLSGIGKSSRQTEDASPRGRGRICVLVRDLGGRTGCGERLVAELALRTKVTCPVLRVKAEGVGGPCLVVRGKVDAGRSDGVTPGRLILAALRLDEPDESVVEVVDAEPRRDCRLAIALRNTCRDVSPHHSSVRRLRKVAEISSSSTRISMWVGDGVDGGGGHAASIISLHLRTMSSTWFWWLRRHSISLARRSSFGASMIASRGCSDRSKTKALHAVWQAILMGKEHLRRFDGA
jgi:hypothetical protein